jgi:hypothetical protein
VLVAPLVLPLIDEVVCVDLVILHSLLLVLAHELSKGAVELSHILREELSIAKNLQQKLLLVFFPDKAPFDPKSLVGNLLPTVIKDFLVPVSSLLLLFESLNFRIPLLDSKLADLSELARIINLVRLKQSLMPMIVLTLVAVPIRYC